MSIREIVHIDEEKCDGCGDCVPACAEGAIQIIDGKARLVADRLCDGLGACLGHCPQGAITVERREADEFDEAAVEQHLTDSSEHPQPLKQPHAGPPPASGCPGSQIRRMQTPASSGGRSPRRRPQSCLGQWPIQLTLVPPQAPFLKGSDLLICADCVPFAVPDFHQRYLAGRAVLVGCPKLDNLQAYYEKLREIFGEAQPSRITVLRMEVPCCGGIAQATHKARNEVSAETPLEIHTIGIDGRNDCRRIPAESRTGTRTA